MTDIAELALRVDALEVKTANAELDRLSGTSKRVDRDVAAFSANSSRSLEFVKTGVAALVAGFAGLSLSRSIKESIELNQRYKELGIAMEVVGRNVGIQSQQLNATTAALEKMGISMIEARQTVTRLAASHIDLANAEKLADLARNAAIVGQINTSEALDRIVHGIRSAEVEVLKTIGITVQFDQAYKQLASQLGKTTNELTQQEKQQARVNVVLDQAPALVGLYEAAMNNAGKQFRSTERLAENLKIKIGELFDETTKLAVRSYTNLLKELDSTFTDLTDSGELQTWGDQLAYTFAFLGDAARVAVSPVIILLRTVDAAIERAKALASGDFAKSRQIGADFDEFLKGELKVITGSTALRDELRKQRVERDLLTSAVGRGATAVQKETEEIIESVKVGKQSRDERKEFINSLAKQAVEAGKSRIEIQRMEAALLGVSDAAEPYLRIIENQAIAEEDLRVSRQQQADDLRKIESITQSVRTKQEIYNDTVKELDDLLSKGLGMDAYNRALSKAREELTKTEVKTREFWDTNEQIWIQGVRNVQTSLANGLFNIFDDGLKGMVNGVKRAVGQMIAEFASIKILQSTGIAGLLGMGSTAAFASGGAASGGGLSALNLASLGSSAFNLAQGGFGLTGAIGGGLSSIGSALGIGSVANFGAGLAGTAATFTGPTAFIGGAGTAIGGSATGAAAGLGASVGAIAGPLAIAAAVDLGLKAIFGDKKLGGTAGDVFGYVPIVGTLINGLFGRGAPKFQNEALVGNVSAGGFDGVLNQAFREKGGVFRSNRVSNFIADTDTGNLLNQFGRLSESGNIPGALRDSATDPAVKRALEVGEFLDEAFGGIGDTLKITADKLGLSSDALNNFSIELDLVSKKGETLSEAQISEEITRISDAMIETLIPNLDDLSKKGETSADTLNRLNAQFSVLESAAMLFGNTAEQAAEKVRAIGIDGQSAFIDSLGGVANAAAEIQQFYDTVFTDSQKLEVTRNQILGVLQPLGVDFIPTLSQLYDAVASGNPELIQAALKVDGLVAEFNQLSESIGQAVDAVADLTAINNERVALETKLLQLQGDTSALRQRELDALHPANRALLDRIFALEDEQEAARAAEIVAGERLNLETRLLQLQGDTAELRRRELDALDPANRALLERIFAIEDERQKNEALIKSREELSRSLSAAMSDFDRLVSAERSNIENSFRAMMTEIDASIKDTSGSVSGLQSVISALQSGVEQIQGTNIADAQTAIRAELNLARSGNVIDLDKIRGAIATVSSRDDSGFSTREAFERARGQDAGLLLDLNSVAMSELSAAERSLELLEEQKTILQQQLENELSALSKISDNTKMQVDAILGVDTTINALLGGKSPLIGSIQAMSQSVVSLARASRQDIPAFASGGMHSGGLRIVGERGPELEFTGPSRIMSNNDLSRVISNPNAATKQDIERLIVVAAEIAEATRKTTDLLMRVTRDGESLVTSAA